jgi:hypothetical protein
MRHCREAYHVMHKKFRVAGFEFLIRTNPKHETRNTKLSFRDE